MTTSPSPIPPGGPDRHHSEFASFHEGYVRHYITLADTKAAWTFAIASGLLAYVFGKDDARRALLNPEWSASYAILVAAVGLLLLSAFHSFLVVAPRLKSPSGEGIVFFGTVAKKPDAASYFSEVVAHSDEDMTKARLNHCYDVSRVCAGKYASLKKAMWFGLPGLALALTYVLVR